MNCNCSKAYPIPQCIDQLQIGVVDPGLTDLYVQFECTVTGRIQRIGPVDPQADGLLIIDVSDISNFFSPRLEIEMTVLTSLETTGDFVPVKVGGQEFECVLLNFINGESELAVIALKEESVQLMKFSISPEGRGTTLAIKGVWEGLFIADYGDSSKRVLYSGAFNTYDYPVAAAYQGNVRGDFTVMTELDLFGANIDGISLPSKHAIVKINLSSNKLTSKDVDDVLINFMNLPHTAVDILLSGQTPAAPPSETGEYAKAVLIARGTNVITD